MSTLSERITWLLDHFKITQSELARAAKVKQPSVYSWLSGRTKTLNSETALAICARYPVMLEWLVNGVGEPLPKAKPVLSIPEDGDDTLFDEHFVVVKASNVQCSAGPGYEPTYEDLEEAEGRAYRRSWLQKHHLNPKDLKVFSVHGESMEPVLWDGDSITVDLSSKYIQNDKVYAFTYNGEYRVKRLRKMLDGGILVISDNPTWQPEKIEAQDTEGLFIIGKVVDKSGTGGL